MKFIGTHFGSSTRSISLYLFHSHTHILSFSYSISLTHPLTHSFAHCSLSLTHSIPDTTSLSYTHIVPSLIYTISHFQTYHLSHTHTHIDTQIHVSLTQISPLSQKHRQHQSHNLSLSYTHIVLSLIYAIAILTHTISLTHLVPSLSHTQNLSLFHTQFPIFLSLSLSLSL